MVTMTSLITPTLISKLTVSGTFAFFGGFSLLSLLHIFAFVRQTNYLEKDKDGNQTIIGLTEKEKKELYWPQEFKS